MSACPRSLKWAFQGGARVPPQGRHAGDMGVICMGCVRADRWAQANRKSGYGVREPIQKISVLEEIHISFACKADVDVSFACPRYICEALSFCYAQH